LETTGDGDRGGGRDAGRGALAGGTGGADGRAPAGGTGAADGRDCPETGGRFPGAGDGHEQQKMAIRAGRRSDPGGSRPGRSGKRRTRDGRLGEGASRAGPSAD
jgi:hypothetical protein